jgi:hypothetical protein
MADEAQLVQGVERLARVVAAHRSSGPAGGGAHHVPV